MRESILLLLLLTCLLSAFAGNAGAPRRLVVGRLEPQHGEYEGTWGLHEYCPDDTWASSFEVKFQDYTAMETDETAVNGIMLYCSDLSFHEVAIVTSVEGENGVWQGLRPCETGFLTGMRTKILEPQGDLLDDVSIQNLEMECDFGTQYLMGVAEITTPPPSLGKIAEGYWEPRSSCPDGSAVCSISIRYDPPLVFKDSIAVCDFTMDCCPVVAPTTAAAPHPAD